MNANIANAIWTRLKGEGHSNWIFLTEQYEDQSSSSTSSFDLQTNEHTWSGGYNWDTINIPADSYLARITPIDGRGNQGSSLITQQFIVDNTPNLIGDYNRDKVVNAADYTIWRDSLDDVVNAFAEADGSGNGLIDQEDYDLWLANYGQTETSSSQAITAVVSPPSTPSSNLLSLSVQTEESKLEPIPVATIDRAFEELSADTENHEASPATAESFSLNQMLLLTITAQQENEDKSIELEEDDDTESCDPQLILSID